jgi:hypothetical protein
MPAPHRATPIDRRTLLKQAAAGSLLTPAILAPSALASGRRKPPTLAWPRAKLPTGAATEIESSEFFSTELLAAYGAEVNGLGLRATGSRTHEAYIRVMANRLRRAGLQDVHLEAAPLHQWLAQSWSITADGTTFPDTYYVPYSHPTPPSGITAEMVYLPIGELLKGSVSVSELKDALEVVGVRGKIGVFEVPYTEVPYATWEALSYSGAWYDPSPQNPLATYARPWFNQIGTILTALIDAGAAGLIGIWPDLPGAWARQYTPYDAVLRPIPGLWIDSIGGAKLRPLAEAGAKVTIKLRAAERQIKTHNLIGFIPGSSSEITALNTHTDGTNGMEENAQLAILAAVQYLARVPRKALPRTIMVMLSTGHFASGIGITTYVNEHQHDVVPRISSVLTLEHLGCVEWLPTAAGPLRPTGRTEFGAYFTPDAKGMINALETAVRRDEINSTVARPFVPSAGTKENTFWPGEGSYWWLDGVLDSNFISGPYGLITAGLDTTGMVDYALLRRKAMTAVKTTMQLAGTSAGELAALPV